MSTNLPANPMADFAQRAAVKRAPQTYVEGGYLRFNGKTGDWSVGVDETPVKGEEALINSPAMMHGYMRWGESPPAKAFTSVAQDYPEKPEPIDGVDYDGKPCTFHAKEARQISGKFLADDQDQFIFNTDSMGGVERMDQLFDKILLKASDGTAFCFPLVKLECDWYKRATGKVFKPIFEIVKWCDQNGVPETAADRKLEKKKAVVEDDVEDDVEPEPTSRRRRRAA